MATVNPSTFGVCPQLELSSGAPAVGNLLFFYAAGTTTKVNTYTSSTGTTPNANPIVLNSLGQPPSEIWFTNGQSYKMVYAPSTDTDPPTNPIRTFDNLYGINDTTLSAALSEWILSTLTPTYVNATTITLPGNQTGLFEVNRRIKTTNTGGTIYSTITASVFTTLTTLTLSNDSGVIDSGISNISYGFLAYQNNSYVAKTATNLAAGSAGTEPYQSAAGTTAMAAAGTLGQLKVSNGAAAPTYGISPGMSLPVSASVATNALTINLANCYLDFRSGTLTSGTVSSLATGALSIIVPATSNLGRILSAQTNELVVLVANSGGTPVLCVANIAGGIEFSEMGVISPTTIGTASNSSSVIYSSAAVAANSAYRVVGRVDSVFTDASGWSAPTLIQGFGGNAINSMSSIGYGQKYTDVTGSRAPATTYYNLTGRPILVSASFTSTISAYAQITITSGGTSASFLGSQAVAGGNVISVTAIIPPGASYSATVSAGVATLGAWAEMR